MRQTRRKNTGWVATIILNAQISHRSFKLNADFSFFVFKCFSGLKNIHDSCQHGLQDASASNWNFRCAHLKNRLLQVRLTFMMKGTPSHWGLSMKNLMQAYLCWITQFVHIISCWRKNLSEKMLQWSAHVGKIFKLTSELQIREERSCRRGRTAMCHRLISRICIF